MDAASSPAVTDPKAKRVDLWEMEDNGPGVLGAEGNSIYVYQPNI